MKKVLGLSFSTIIYYLPELFIHARQDMGIDGRHDFFTHLDRRFHDDFKSLTLAYDLEPIGRYEDADRLCGDAINLCKRLRLAQDHPVTLMWLDERSLVLTGKGEYTQAKDLSCRTLDSMKTCKDLGTSNASTVRCAYHLARILRLEGRYQEAFEMIVGIADSTEISPYESVAGTNLIAVQAEILRDLGDYEECARLSKLAVKAFHELLGPQHPVTMYQESDYAVALTKLGKYAIAERVTRRALKSIAESLGAAHPRTLRVSKRLADCMRFQGYDTEAEMLYEETLDTQQRVLSFNHVDTLSTYTGLALVYASQGAFQRAYYMLKRVYESYSELFGKSHSDTKWIYQVMNGFNELSSIVLQPDDAYTLVLEDHILQLALVPNRPSEIDCYRKMSEFDASGFPLLWHSEILKRLEKNLFVEPLRIGRALRCAAAAGQITIIESLLEASAPCAHSEGGYWGTALEAASRNGHHGIVLHLVNHHKVNVGLRHDGALRAACFSGQLKIVTYLMQKGARCSTADPVLGTPLQAAIAGGHVQVIELLLSNKNHGAKISVDTEDDVMFGTALQTAVVAGHKDLVALLLKHGANPASARFGGFGSALELAATTRQDRMLELLLTKSKGVSQDAFVGVLQAIARTGHRSALDILLQFYASGTKVGRSSSLVAVSPPNTQKFVTEGVKETLRSNDNSNNDRAKTLHSSKKTQPDVLNGHVSHTKESMSTALLVGLPRLNGKLKADTVLPASPLQTSNKSKNHDYNTSTRVTSPPREHQSPVRARASKQRQSMMDADHKGQ